MRRTDLFVHEQVSLTPLSVSADRIAPVALRCAVLLAKLEAVGGPMDRSGSGPVVEVYPAVSLRSWSLDHRGYKQGADTKALGRLVDRLWMKLRGLTARYTSRRCAAHTTPSTPSSPP